MSRAQAPSFRTGRRSNGSHEPAGPEGIDVAYPRGPGRDRRQWRGRITFGMCKVTQGLTVAGPTIVSSR